VHFCVPDFHCSSIVSGAFLPRGSDFSCRIFDTAEEYSDGQRILFVQVGLVPSRLDMGG
jgi:hypothetical protein